MAHTTLTYETLTIMSSVSYCTPQVIAPAKTPTQADKKAPVRTDMTPISQAINILETITFGALWVIPWVFFWIVCTMAVSLVSYTAGLAIEYMIPRATARQSPNNKSDCGRKRDGADDDRPEDNITPKELVAMLGISSFLISASFMGIASLDSRVKGSGGFTIAFGLMLVVAAILIVIVSAVATWCLACSAYTLFYATEETSRHRMTLSRPEAEDGTEMTALVAGVARVAEVLRAAERKRAHENLSEWEELPGAEDSKK